MKIPHFIIITVFLVTSIVLLTTLHHSYASTCAVKETIYSAPEFFLLSDNVFVGNVTSITDYGNHQWQVHFNIEKIWKGFATRQTSTVMTNTLQACGYSITIGEKYLIYTNGSPSTINPIFSKMYSDAQNDIALFDDPKFQSEEKTKEDLNKKLEAAQGIVGSMMMDKSSHIPINGVGVDQVNSTLDIMIDDEKAMLSVEQYTQNLKNILGDIPIKVEFGHATTLMPILHNANDSGLTTSYPITHGSNSSNVLKSPLRQFKSGITASDVQCAQGLELVIKAEDNSPACVKFSTAESLIRHGWASSESGISSDGIRTYIIQDSSASSKTSIINNTSCNTPYLRSDSDITVLYMPTNSTGKICVKYYNLNNTPVGVGIRIFEENNMTQNAPDIITWASNSTLQGNENTTISYFIKTGNKAGFYGLSMFCGGMPFAVGYDENSTLTASDFSALERVIHCPAQSYIYNIEGVEGIGIRYIPNSLNSP